MWWWWYSAERLFNKSSTVFLKKCTDQCRNEPSNGTTTCSDNKCVFVEIVFNRRQNTFLNKDCAFVTKQNCFILRYSLVKQFLYIICEYMVHMMSFKISKNVIFITALQLDIKPTARERSYAINTIFPVCFLRLVLLSLCIYINIYVFN